MLATFLWAYRILVRVLGCPEIAAAIRLRKEIEGEIWRSERSGLVSVVLGVVVTWMLLTRRSGFLALGWLIGYRRDLRGDDDPHRATASQGGSFGRCGLR